MSFIQDISKAFKRGKDLSARESAKQRLHLVLINDRASQDTPDFLPMLRNDIIEVLKKYVPDVDDDNVAVNMENLENTSIMEVSVSLDKN